ncbi:MAG: TRAP transporter small permease subunit [Mailhella sp.]|nr:TRAP transporter small permease subunit [Mailhella sp.]
MLKSIVHGIDKFNTAISNVTMWLMIPLVGVMLYEAIRRYFFNAPTVWGMELSMMIFGAYIIFSGPSSILQRVQVGVDLFSSKWEPRTRAVVNCLTYGFTFVFFFQLLKTSVIYAIESWELQELSSSAWGQPVYHWKTLIPIAIGLMMLQSFAEFLRNVWMAVKGEKMP